jgi:disulfide oxidoreductase YuzD
MKNYLKHPHKISLLNQVQSYNNYSYKITDLIEASKNLKVFKIKTADVFTDYEAPCNNTLTDFINHCKKVLNADLNYPIILSPDNFILDGKHRLSKAIIENTKYIKAVRLEKMPDCGEYIEN